MYRSLLLGACLLMSSLNAESRTISSIEEVPHYVTAGAWVVWDLDGTLFKFENDIPHSWLTDKAQSVFTLSCDRADRTLSLTGSYSYLYQDINKKLDELGAQFYFPVDYKDIAVPLDETLQSFAYNGVCYSGTQSKGNAFKQYLDQVNKENLPPSIVFIDDTLKHIMSVSQMMQQEFPSIRITCLYYQSK
jgi:hypothetical protein